ncbi:MAG: hypothetical protein JKY48_19435 [Flavobacteriales bacterium]|nr:hypothetical protein [Flavobacteriales bacterium]
MKAFFKLSFVLTLIGIISYGSAHKSWLRVSYEINKLEIIEKFCINKEETTFTCDGKCHLKTELEKIDSEEEQAPNHTTAEEKLTLFAFSFQKKSIKNIDAHLLKFEPYQINYTSQYSSSLYRPPCA